MVPSGFGNTSPLLERLGCSHETYQILDFYHVTGGAFVMPLFSQDTERKNGSNRSSRKEAKSLPCEQMTACSKNWLMVSLRNMTAQINYLTKGYAGGRLNYAKVANLEVTWGS